MNRNGVSLVKIINIYTEFELSGCTITYILLSLNYQDNLLK